MIPFGKHQGKPLAGVPGDYLAWLLREVKLSAGLRRAVVDELRRRGLTPPAPPPPPPEPDCRRCGPDGAVRYGWYEDRLGRRRIRRECGRCGASLGFAPTVEPFVFLADGNASATPILDTLVLAAELKVGLKSDGVTVDFATGDDGRRAPPRLRALLNQCRATLGRLLGRYAD
jgi:hypothetical protein